MNRRDALKGLGFGAFMLATFGNSNPAPAAEELSVQDLYRPALKGVTDWEEELRRCKYGWTAPDGVYINGFCYFNCNYVYIATVDLTSDSKRPVWTRPYYRETDRMITQMIWDGKNGKASRNHISAGARGTGVSCLLELGVGLHNFLFEPFPIAFVSASDSLSEHENQIFFEALKRLPPQFVDHKSIFRKNDIITAENKKKRAYFRTYPTNISEGRRNFRWERLSNLFILSAGYIPKKNLVQTVQENTLSLGLNQSKWGGCIMCGSWDGNSNHGHGDFFNGKHETWLPSTKYFSPATDRPYFLDMKTGKVNQRLATEKVKKLRERYGKNHYYGPQDIIENPLTVKELFTLEPV